MAIALKIITSTSRPGRRPTGAAVADDAASPSDERFDVEVLDLRDWRLPLFQETARRSATSPIRRTPTRSCGRGTARSSRASAFVFLTAEYNHSVPGELKNAIDNVFVSYGVPQQARRLRRLQRRQRRRRPRRRAPRPHHDRGRGGRPAQHRAHRRRRRRRSTTRTSRRTRRPRRRCNVLRGRRRVVGRRPRPGPRRGPAGAGQRPLHAGAGGAALLIAAAGVPAAKMAAMKVVDTLRSVMQFRKLELDPVARRLATAASVGDLRRIAQRRLPRGVFDYIDGGAEDERTLRNNSDAFARIEFRPRVLRSVATIDTSTTLLGRPLPFPLALAPTGFTRIADPAGRARRRPGRGARRPAVHAVDAVDALDRGGRRGQRAAGSGSRCTRGATAGLVKDMVERCRASRLRGARDDGRHGDARPPRARRAAGLRDAAEARHRHAARRRRAPRLDVGVRARRADRVRQRRHGTVGRRRRSAATAATPVTLADVRQRAVRPQPVVGRRRLVPLDVGRPDRSSRGSSGSPTPCSPPSAASTPSPCPTTAAASSTRRRRRSSSSRPSSTPSATAPR